MKYCDIGFRDAFPGPTLILLPRNSFPPKVLSTEPASALLEKSTKQKPGLREVNGSTDMSRFSLLRVMKYQWHSDLRRTSNICPRAGKYRLEKQSRVCILDQEEFKVIIGHTGKGLPI